MVPDRVQYFVAALLAILIVSCSPSIQTGTNRDYYEDLTVLRPVYSDSINRSDGKPEVELIEDPVEEEASKEPKPVFDITHKLDSLLDSIALNNQQIKFVQGYTIQVYTGNSQDEAQEAKAEVYRILPDSRPQVSYDLPNYKLKVGKYYHRLQAQKEFAAIKKVFPSAILVPQQFKID